MIETEAEDLWWVAVDGEIQDELVGLESVAKLKEMQITAQISVLHVSLAEDEDAEWIIFERDPSAFRLAADRSKRSRTRAFRFNESEMETAAADNDAAPAQVPPGGGASSEEFEALKSEVDALREELNELKTLADDLKQPIMEAKQVLEEREQFLEMSENSLFDKAQKQEVLSTELEQMREELKSREKEIEKREQELEKSSR